ncbi:MAG TPA: hypothetical protein VMV29_06995 [Ktedonobacterales bacterium]|nr:hypothetical protein [Ktedonobacterales bacterium]
MRLFWRFPRVTAWLATVIVIGGATAGAALGLHAAPSVSSASLRHIHGVVVSTQGNDEFALATPGRPGREWFHLAPGAHISMAHLRRHLHEHAGTDVTYQITASGMLIAWTAD